MSVPPTPVEGMGYCAAAAGLLRGPRLLWGCFGIAAGALMVLLALMVALLALTALMALMAMMTLMALMPLLALRALMVALRR